MSQPILRDTLFTEFDKIKRRLDVLENSTIPLVSALPASGYDGALVCLQSSITGRVELWRWDTSAWQPVCDQAIGARVYHNSNQTQGHGIAWTPVAFNSERYDYGGLHDNSTNNSRLTAPVNGFYMVSFVATWASNNVGIRAIGFRKNGSSYLATRFDTGLANNNSAIADAVYLNASDYVEVMVFQTSGGNLDLQTQAEYGSHFAMIKVG